MSEQATQEAPAEDTVEVKESPAADGKQETFDADYVAKLRAENAKYRTEAKANAEAKAKLAELEEAGKTEAQKQAERLAELEKELTTERTSKMRLQVGAEKGLPKALISRLQGSTVEEMEADADELLAGLKDSFVPKSKPTPEQTGAGASGESDDDDTAAIARKIMAR